MEVFFLVNVTRESERVTRVSPHYSGCFLHGVKLIHRADRCMCVCVFYLFFYGGGGWQVGELRVKNAVTCAAVQSTQCPPLRTEREGGKAARTFAPSYRSQIASDKQQRGAWPRDHNSAV